MRKASYEEPVRTAFTKAAQDARTEGKSWSDAYAAAASAGYGGTLAGIKQFLIKASGKAPQAKEEAADGAPEASAPKTKKNMKRKVKAAADTAGDAQPEVEKEEATKGSKRTRMIYDQAMKESILNAVAEARKEGDWTAAHKAAEGAGYKGGVSGLMQFVTKKTGTTAKPAKAAAKAAAKAKKMKMPALGAPTAAAPSSAASSGSTDSRGSVAAGFALESIPEAIRSDFSGWVRGKIEKEFKHAIADQNVAQATAMYLDILAAQGVLDSKIAALKAL